MGKKEMGKKERLQRKGKREEEVEKAWRKKEKEQAKGKNSTLGKGNKGERGKTEEKEGTMGRRIVHEGEG